jgi:hypothetical protein
MNVNLSGVAASLRSVWDELLERRLWPFALALVVAIIAILVVLSKPAKQPPPVPPAPAATGGSSPSVAFQPAVSTEGKKSSEIRKNLRHFQVKNPFTPQGLTSSAGSTGSAGNAQPVAQPGTSGGTVTPTTTSSSTSTGSSGGSTGSTGTANTAPSTSTQTFYYTYTVDVKFGKTGKEDAKTLNKFRALPGSDNPIVVFIGVRNDGETAVFLVSANATTTGDGKCSPSDTECTFLYLKKKQSQTIEAVDADGAITDYTLELTGINVKKTKGPERAQSHSSSSKASRARLRSVTNNLDAFGF